MSIAITGANGEFGRGVLEAVAEQAPDRSIIATVRDVSGAAALVERGIDVRAGSFDEPDTLRRSFDGASTVLINATFFGTAPELRQQRVANAVEASAASGVQRIVLTSWPNLERARIPLVQDFVQSERAVKDAGPAWTILRLAYGLADAVARDVMWARRDGELVAPAGTARCTPAAVPDLIDATAATVLEAGTENHVHEITGPRAVDWNELADLASRLDGRVLRYRAVGDDEYRDRLTSQGVPADAVEGLLGLYEEFRTGWSAQPSPTLETLLGREPIDTRQAIGQRVRE